jgi:calcium channel MID1
MDYTTTKPWLQERNVAQPFPNKTMLADSFVASVQNILYWNSSRNPKIDTEIQPGPYKEILPCEDLCYDLVQSCPAVMGFACPRPGRIGFASSYGRRPNGSDEQDGQITCNYPGAAYHYNAAGMVGPCVWVVLVGVALWGFVLF